MQRFIFIFSIGLLIYSCNEANSSSDATVNAPITQEEKKDAEPQIDNACDSGDCINGIGKQIKNGYTYIGEFKNGERHGKGTNTWSNGNKYTGQWENNKMHGVGTIITGRGVKYEGEWMNGRKNGKGTCVWPSGSRYKGEWKDDYKHGKGTNIFPDGNKYVGKWKNGKRHGRATTYTNFFFGKKRRRPKNNNDYDRIRRRVWENDKETGKNW